ncbi:hypothetical protein CYMTET_54434 [Cymbomonas tetramitiformis]|uniref:Uncharacterized protein n=1 Tax=Cymbomonas tetramitiformis TaxID=36881 RepID=A0AAE0BGA5_9CHLO|nr:hypothetical protein CYMTET_54434 [Cymbomonas tetramitiformis]
MPNLQQRAAAASRSHSRHVRGWFSDIRESYIQGVLASQRGTFAKLINYSPPRDERELRKVDHSTSASNVVWIL